ncbi:MAG: sn-glycerol-3-phosphate ABC transporter ATP-binding protein UgpC [Pseudomonadota bacterium]
MASVTLESVRKVYDNGYVAVHDASFEVNDGEFVVLVGPSGCGKSTTLRMVAGLEDISSGTLRIGDRVVNDVAPKDRDIAMVFQNYALYPHMTIFDNMAFGLKLRKFPKREIEDRVQNAAKILGLEATLDRKPKALSGGQRQRVALGRAIVRKPQVFLFDEPLSNLDAKLRVQTRTEISKLHSQLQATMLYVTHDQVEAMTMGDRIVVLKDGYVQQIAPPLELYDRPVNQFVAGFIGSPSMNFLEGRIERGGDTLQFVNEHTSFSLGTTFSGRQELAGQKVTVGIRPEDIYLDGYVPTGRLTVPMPVRLDVTEPMGNEIFVYGTLADTSVVARIEPAPLPNRGDTVTYQLHTDKLHLFDSESEASLSAHG